MVTNNIEIDMKVKCVEEQTMQARLTERIDVPASYLNKLIKMDEKVANNTFAKMLEALGYEIELHYVKRNNTELKTK